MCCSVVYLNPDDIDAMECSRAFENIYHDLKGRLCESEDSKNATQRNYVLWRGPSKNTKQLA
jgi:hypothetical protein